MKTKTRQAFDVDDPLSNSTIDPNGGDGKDNRGRLASNVAEPAPSQNADAGGFRGRLKPLQPAGQPFDAEKGTTPKKEKGSKRGQARMALS